MKQKIKNCDTAILRYSLFLMLFLTSSRLNAQQVLINTGWEQSFGNPSQLDWSASVLDGGNNIITTGHTVISSTKIAMLLVKQSPDGITLWQKQFTIANDSKNYGIALTTDNANNIYVAGTCYESDTTGKYNMLIIKYNFNGTKLWHKTYNSNANDDDGAVSILCNTSGSDVYVTGPSIGTGSEADYLTLKLNGSTGATVWEQRYNNTANLDDIPVALSFDASGKIVVAGGSATDALNYDIMTMKYNASGTFSDSLRIANPGSGYDQASSLFKDNTGNLYITGRCRKKLSSGLNRVCWMPVL
jgi:hypothetical protein